MPCGTVVVLILACDPHEASIIVAIRAVPFLKDAGARRKNLGAWPFLHTSCKLQFISFALSMAVPSYAINQLVGDR